MIGNATHFSPLFISLNTCNLRAMVPLNKLSTNSHPQKNKTPSKPKHKTQNWPLTMVALYCQVLLVSARDLYLNELNL